MMPAAWRTTVAGVDLRIRLTPRTAADRVDGLAAAADGAVLKVRVRAVPENGKANAALMGVIANWLQVSRSAVTITSGPKSRTKMVSIAGDGAALVARVEAALAGLEGTLR